MRDEWGARETCGIRKRDASLHQDGYGTELTHRPHLPLLSAVVLHTIVLLVWLEFGLAYQISRTDEALLLTRKDVECERLRFVQASSTSRSIDTSEGWSCCRDRGSFWDVHIRGNLVFFDIPGLEISVPSSHHLTSSLPCPSAHRHITTCDYQALT